MSFGSGAIRRLLERMSQPRSVPGSAGEVDASPLVVQGVEHQRAGRLAEAEAALRTALRANPRSATAYNVLGIVLHQRGDLPGAQASFGKAAELDPRSFEAQNNLGNSLLEGGQVARAEACYRAAVAIKPGFLQGHANLGGLLRQSGRLDEAAECYERVLAGNPGDAEALSSIGSISLALRRLPAAETYLRRAVEANPRSIAAHCNLAEALLSLGKAEEAERAARSAFDLGTDSAKELGLIAMALKRFDPATAESCCRRALAINPLQASSHTNLGLIQRARGNRAAAMASFREALRLEPGAASAQYNLANGLLLEGEYARGFELYESRFNALGDRAAPMRKFEHSLGTARRWKGEATARSRLLVWAEQGFGDSIMMLRYLPLLASRGFIEVFVACEPPLARLVKAMPSVTRVVTAGDEISDHEFDLHCPIMSMPAAFKSRLDSLPQKVPYLSASASLVEDWGRRFPAGQLRVGLAWAGSPSLEADALRNIPYVALEPILEVTGARFISLQKAPDASGHLPRDSRVLDLMAECSDFMDTAALIENLDLVISADTAVAHLAGALGKEVWLLNRFESEWRWGLEGDRSAWYPTLRVFRQSRPGDWDEVTGRVKQALMRRVGALLGAPAASSHGAVHEP
jgi:tetratricopeptide (TPR) repeat protein